jgi:hypothetical protein
VSEKHGTHGDEMDMDRMGKLQVLRVSFSMFQLLLQHTYNIISGNSSFCPSSASL